MSKHHDIPTCRRSPAATLARLAQEAWEGHSALIVHGGIRGCLTSSEHRVAVLQLLWKKRRPGAFIEAQPPEVRERLRNLKSEDVANAGAFPDWYGAQK